MQRVGIAVIAIAVVAVIKIGWDLAAFAAATSMEAPLAASLVDRVGAGSVLAVLAHPDDEVFVAGALRDAVERGLETRLITVTAGGRAQRPPVVADEHIHAVRAAEAFQYGYILGLRSQEVWEFPAGGAWDVGALRARLEDRMNRWLPDLVLTFHPGSGFTGHRDHKEVGAWATRLAPSCIAYVLAPTGWLKGQPDTAYLRAAASQPKADVAVPSDYWMKVWGWRIHRSQRIWVDARLALPPAVAYLLWRREHYALSGCDLSGPVN